MVASAVPAPVRTTRLRIGAHVDATAPLAAAAERGADVVQFFLTDPQSYAKPKPREDAEALRAADVDVVVHAPYLINLASTNNRIRIPSRSLLKAHAEAAAAIGARALVVHGGHVGADVDPAVGVENWRKAFAYAEDSGGFPLRLLLENTAGGDGAMARRLDRLDRLWDAIGSYQVGFCLDTCHAYAGGEELAGIVDRVLAITGRIDLVHLNDSKGAFDSGQDRHANIGGGRIDPAALVEVVAAAGAPVVVETPAAGQSDDISFLRDRLA